jgi:hypothetical protein
MGVLHDGLDQQATRAHVARMSAAKSGAAAGKSPALRFAPCGLRLLTFKDEVWTVGFGVTYKFGAPVTAALSGEGAAAQIARTAERCHRSEKDRQLTARA